MFQSSGQALEASSASQLGSYISRLGIFEPRPRLPLTILAIDVDAHLIFILYVRAVMHFVNDQVLF